MRRLLFLNGIKAFEAAARTGSFAAAGLELSVSAAAVSRMKGIDVDKLDWSQLAIDAGTLNDIIAAKKRAQATANNGLNWSSNANANGSSAVTVKQSVFEFWDTRIGADMA